MSFEIEKEEGEPEFNHTITMAQLIATNKIMMQLVDELTERHETSSRLLLAAKKFLHPDHPTRALLIAVIKLLDKDLKTYLWDMDE